jgi:hypothetical protein
MFTMPGWTMFATACASSFPEAAAGPGPDGGTGMPPAPVPEDLGCALDGPGEPEGCLPLEAPAGLLEEVLGAAVPGLATPGPELPLSATDTPAPVAAARTATITTVRGRPRLRGRGGSGTGW